MNRTSRVAVASRSFSKHPMLREELKSKYAHVTFNDEGRLLSGKVLIDFLKGHDMAITALERLDQDVFSSLPELKVVGKYGVGLDMVDLVAMEKAGIKIGWTGGVNRRSVSELVVAAAVQLLHRVPEAGQLVRDGGWYQIKGCQLTGKTVGIIGCGHVGKDLVLLLKAFDCKILVHDIRSFPDFYEIHAIEPAGLDNLLKRSDVVTLHLPLDDSTMNMLTAQKLSLMKKGAVLINMARGGLIDEKALKQMLIEGHLKGAALDVFRDEPPIDLELVKLPNFLSTPHIGGSTEEAVLAMGRAAIMGLETPVLPSQLTY